MAKGKYQKWLEPDALILLEGWARDGLTDEQIAKNMNVSYSTLRSWKEKYSALSAAITRGKEVTDYIVENALYKSAIGYSVTVKKPIKVKTEKSVPGKGKIVEERIEYAEEEVYIPANTQAQQFWLKNRQPDKWRHTSKDSLDIKEQNARIDKLNSDIEKNKILYGDDTEEIMDDGFLKALEGSAVSDWSDFDGDS